MNVTDVMIEKLMDNAYIIVEKIADQKCVFCFKNTTCFMHFYTVNNICIFMLLDSEKITFDFVINVNLQLVLNMQDYLGGIVKIDGKWALAQQFSLDEDLIKALELQSLMRKALFSMLRK